VKQTRGDQQVDRRVSHGRSRLILNWAFQYITAKSDYDLRWSLWSVNYDDVV